MCGGSIRTKCNTALSWRTDLMWKEEGVENCILKGVATHTKDGGLDGKQLGRHSAP